MSFSRNGWLTTKEVLDYVATKHNRHWSRAWFYVLLKENDFSRAKVGYQNIYKQKDIDTYISCLQRPSSSG